MIGKIDLRQSMSSAFVNASNFSVFVLDQRQSHHWLGFQHPSITVNFLIGIFKLMIFHALILQHFNDLDTLKVAFNSVIVISDNDFQYTLNLIPEHVHISNFFLDILSEDIYSCMDLFFFDTTNFKFVKHLVHNHAHQQMT